MQRWFVVMTLYDVRKREVYEAMLLCSIQTIALYLQCSNTTKY